MLKPFFTRRWLALTLLFALIIPSFYELSQWQWRRLAGRQAYNASIMHNRAQSTGPIASIITSVGNDRTTDEANQWRNVQLTGTWDVTHQVLVRKKSLESDAGFWVMTPFLDQSGVTVMVNRGWRILDASAVDTPSVTPPPTGTVEVAARVRMVKARTKARPNDLPTGQVDSVQPREIVPDANPLLVNAYVEMTASRPVSNGSDLRLIPEPELDEGPHRSYAMQWLAFIVLAIVGYGILAKNEIADYRATQAQESTENSED